MHEAAAEARRRRLRAWRRGTREMDLILGPFADARLAGLDAAGQALFDRLLAENDHDLYQWITARLVVRVGGTGAARGPAEYAALLDLVAEHAAASRGARRIAPAERSPGYPPSP